MRAAAALLATATVGGCISIPDENAPQCYSSSDCNATAGEVCDEGVCYGDPPTGRFAVSVGAPPDRTDLIGLERPTEDLPSYGFLADLTLEQPVTWTGQVTATSCPASAPGTCPAGPVGATISVRRAPRFAGGDAFVASARSLGADGSTSFALALRRTQPTDADYTVTVVPDDVGVGTGSGLAPAELVPPLRTTLRATDDVATSLALGGSGVAVVSGDLSDADGTALGGYRVSAFGRWPGDTADSEVSSVAYSPDGRFQIAIATGLVGTVTLVAKPLTATTAVTAPTLHVVGIDPTKSQAQHVVAPSGLGGSHELTLTIEGTSTSGTVAPIPGARVLATALVSAAPLPLPGSNVQAVVAADVTTGDDGVAHLPVLDGPAFAGGYRVRVVPPAGSNLAVLDTPTVPLADATLVLKPRVALQGTVTDATGKPVGAVSVTARPALRFQWSLGDASQVFLAQVPAATTVTPDTGDFVLYVDPYVEDVYGFYDLSFEPPSGSSVPSFVLADVAIPRGTAGPTILPLGAVALPAAAALHGRVSDPGGNPVPASELRVFRIPADQSLCTEVTHAPVPCEVPARLQAHATSDSAGVVRFTLPRP